MWHYYTIIKIFFFLLQVGCDKTRGHCVVLARKATAQVNFQTITRGGRKEEELRKRVESMLKEMREDEVCVN